jgi:hypothetical protein
VNLIWLLIKLMLFFNGYRGAIGADGADGANGADEADGADGNLYMETASLLMKIIYLQQSWHEQVGVTFSWC